MKKKKIKTVSWLSIMLAMVLLLPGHSMAGGTGENSFHVFWQSGGWMWRAGLDAPTTDGLIVALGDYADGGGIATVFAGAASGPFGLAVGLPTAIIALGRFGLNRCSDHGKQAVYIYGLFQDRPYNYDKMIPLWCSAQ